MTDESNNCVMGNTNRADIRNLTTALDAERLERAKCDDEVWKEINGLKSRLPVWATTVISLLSFACGALLTYAKMQSG